MPIDPITGALIGQAVGQGVGALFGRKRPKTPDYSGKITALNESGVRQRGLTTGLRPQLNPLGTQFRANNATLGSNYVNNQASAGSAVGNNLADALKRRVMEQQPEAQQNLRESLAATGGLHRGAASIAAQRQGIEAGRQIGEGASNIALGELQGRQEALKGQFGLDQDVEAKLFSSGREDLIREYQDLLDEEKSRTGSIVGLQTGATNARYGADLAKSQNNQDLVQSLIAALGAGGGAYLARGK